MLLRTEVRGDRRVCGEKALRMARRFEPLHGTFPLASWLVRIFVPVIEISMLTMFHTGQHFPFRRPVARQLIGNDGPQDVLLNPLSSLRKNVFTTPLSRLRCTRISSIFPS
jgi:hypothetical protein